MCKRLYERNKQMFLRTAIEEGGSEDIYCANKQGD